MFAHPSGPLLRASAAHGRTTAAFTRPTRLTEETVEALDREFDALVAGPAPPQLTLDLGAVEFLSSVALGQLLALNRRVMMKGGSLVLTNLQPPIHRVFMMTRLDKLLDFDPLPQARAP